MATTHPATTNRSPSCSPCSRLITTTTGPSLTYLPVRRSRAKPETTPPTRSAHNQRIIRPTLGRDTAPDTPSVRRNVRRHRPETARPRGGQAAVDGRPMRGGTAPGHVLLSYVGVPDCPPP